MTNREKAYIIHSLIGERRVSRVYEALEDMGDLKTNYYVYMTTGPVDCDEELKRLPEAEYELCTALLTMLLREDHFCNGSFERRVEEGDVKPLLERMIELLSQDAPYVY